MLTKTVQISEIMESPPTNSGLKKKDVLREKTGINLVPVYSASQNENLIFGWARKDSKWKKYKNLLTWNKDGSSGIVFYRREEFVPYEKVKLLRIRDAYENNLDYVFLKHVLQSKFLSLGFGFNFKCSMQRVLDTIIEIPIKKNGEFDLALQKKIADKFSKIESVRNVLEVNYDKIKSLKVDVSSKYETISVPVIELFNLKKGKADYTKKYIHEHKGGYPVYSSQTTREGEIGKIDTYDYEEECFTWTTDGVLAGTVFYRNGKFSITTHCGILKLKENYINAVNLEYLFFVLNQTLPESTLGEWANRRLGIERMGEISIKIPVKENGEFDLNAQEEIAQKSKKIEQIKKQLESEYENLISSKIQII